MGVENDIFLSEVGSGLGETGGTPPTRIFRSTAPHPRTSVTYPVLSFSEDRCFVIAECLWNTLVHPLLGQLYKSWLV